MYNVIPNNARRTWCYYALLLYAHTQHLSCSWVKDLDLRMQEKNVLQENGMLSDRHMTAANQLLRSQYPSILSLQSTLLGQTKFRTVTQAASTSEGLYLVYNFMLCVYMYNYTLYIYYIREGGSQD